MDTTQAVELLTSIAEQIPMKGHEEDTVYGSIQALASETGDKEPAAQQITHLIMSIPLTRPVRQQAKEAIERLKAQKKRRK